MGNRGRFYFFCEKAKMRAYKLLMIAAVGILAAGCDRMFKDSITFRGEVYSATVSTTTSLITPGLALTGATVQVEDYGNSVKTGASGEYSLQIEAYRSFFSPKADQYKITAFHPRGSGGGDESVYIKARPGDSIEVRPMLIYEYTTSE